MLNCRLWFSERPKICLLNKLAFPCLSDGEMASQGRLFDRKISEGTELKGCSATHSHEDNVTSYFYIEWKLSHACTGIAGWNRFLIDAMGVEYFEGFGSRSDSLEPRLLRKEKKESLHRLSDSDKHLPRRSSI
ncbi:hypothetical protein TRV_01680 [Trichophyton verrucosum HKI 0517]|uniref:Uncharacterized protein n=1 Tax=Trichophyton verrucosum (strain HKI 0517) TaxID=663202 RepID=D4D3M0_TRIVH|nr:uncharacterized protein TRV_01680 [Trichophyton verrucosum HKI 0517]EFE43570.1 hypothetical protein TRV_01680 [Trichophyton verrucosum HKI 0517]